LLAWRAAPILESMDRAARTLLLTLALAACATEDTREPAAFAEVCGVEGPFRLLPLAPGQALTSIWPVAGRFYYIVSDSAHAADEPEHTLWSMGPCGEAPTLVADDISRLRSFALWPDLLLGCREQTRDIVSLDPAGIEPPHVVFADISCYAHETTYGLVTFGSNDEPSPLVLHPYPDDPRSEISEPVVLLDPLPVLDPAVVRQARVWTLQDEVLLLDENDALLRVALADGAVTIEQTDVRDFEVSRDGRYLLWQDLRTTNSDPSRPEGAVLLRDRTTGVGMSLAQTWLSYTGAALNRIDAGYIELVLRTGETRLFSLPTFGFIDLPRNIRLVVPVTDEQWLVGNSFAGPYGLSDLSDGETITPLWPGSGGVVSLEGGRLIIQDIGPCCIGEDFFRDTGPLWSVPFDGSAPQRLTGDIGRFPRRVDERRMLASVDIDAGARATIVLVDLETRDEKLIDEGVSGLFSRVGLLDEDRYWYLVEDGERSGMWVFRLAK
jgi:hypothetical protein